MPNRVDALLYINDSLSFQVDIKIRICLLLPMEDILLLVTKYYDILLVSILVISITVFYLSKVSRRAKDAKSCIPGSLGLPFVGETFALLSATNSVKGCYDFVRLRREW